MEPKKINQFKSQFQLMICKRDYDLMLHHHPELLEEMEGQIAAGVKPEDFHKWTLEMIVDADEIIIQRVTNAARWMLGAAAQ